MITILAGGSGSSKLIRGMTEATDDKLNIISNIGDNIWLFGLYICPDIDTITYTLSDNIDTSKGWGINNDSFRFLDEYKKYDSNVWFNIGDRDLATHVFRTNLKNRGMKLSEITEIITKKLGIKHNIIPASDDPIQTMFSTDDGNLHLQEFWVKNHGKNHIINVNYDGIDKATPTDGVIEILNQSDRIIFANGNPVSSIGPIVKIPKIMETIKHCSAKKIAVSPIIGSSSISGPAGRMLKSTGYESSPFGIAKYYSGLIDSLIIHNTDKNYSTLIRDLNVEPILGNIIMSDTVKEIELSKMCLDL